MKKGCLLLLAVWVGVAAGYFYLFQGTDFEHAWWGPILFGLGAAMIAGNIHGIFLALQQKRASHTPPNQWKDGQYVVASGRISAVRGAITAPFSGIPSCIVEYALKRGDTPGGDYMGFLMTPCALTTTMGSVRLVGFPMLAEIPPSSYVDEASCKRAGEYFAKCKFETKASNPMTLISQLNSVLADDDGDVKADFADKNATLHENFDNYDDEDLENLDEEEKPAPPTGSDAEKIAQKLIVSGYLLEETIVKVGDEVTACGTYRQAKQAIDIGSGLKNISHSLKMGSAAESTGKLMKQSIITLFIIGAIFVGANWVVLNQIGIDPATLPARFGF